MVQLELPDGKVQTFDDGVTGMEVAKSISGKLAKEALGIKVNGRVQDLDLPITENGKVAILTWEDDEGKKVFWHSSAHLLAEALQAFFPDVKFTIGPPVDHGFYYDVDLGDQEISNDIFDRLEQYMLELARQKNPFEKTKVSKIAAKQFYQQYNNPYKLELIEELDDDDITFYTQGSFTDLCRGPHVPHTGYIKAVKLLNIAGAYWRGDERNKQLTRIYGITFPQQKKLDEYLAWLEEAKKRDHRRIGRELSLFTFDEEVGAGLPLWLPNGAFMIEKLEALAKETEAKAGYHRVRTPHIAKDSLYYKSGHLPYYQDSMFPPMELEEGTTYYVKAMNCPHHHKIYLSRKRSYRELPLRLAEYGTCYRYEQSGELYGLMRVRSLQMNDAHIYCTPGQFKDEFQGVNNMYLHYFRIFDIDQYYMRFSTHDPAKLGDKYVNQPELWQETEDLVRMALQDSGIPYQEIPDEAAFYGPKIDVQVYSALGREFTLATNQVDFSQPRSFGLTYVTETNNEATPICIHRAPLGTHERFMGFLIEHYAGNFPTWLAPTQIALLPINDAVVPYAEKIAKYLNNLDIRTSIDYRSEKIGRKIRDAEVMKVPYMGIIGEREANQENLSVRKHTEGDLGTFSLEVFADKMAQETRIPADFQDGSKT